MRESRTIHLDANDFAEIRRGKPLLIYVAEGYPLISIEWEGPRRGTLAPAAPPNGASARVPKAERPTTQCPFCDVRSTHLKTHLYKHHPDKGMSATGPKCRFCPKRYESAHSARRHEVRAHLKEFRAKKVGAKPKEAPHA